MASLQSPALTGSPRSHCEASEQESKQTSSVVSSPQLPSWRDFVEQSFDLKDDPSTRHSTMNNSSGPQGQNSSTRGQKTSNSGADDKKDDQILDALLPRIEARGQSRGSVPNKDGGGGKGKNNS